MSNRPKAMRDRAMAVVERDAYLLQQLESGESVRASGLQAVVTERRIFITWRGDPEGEAPRWTHDAMTFEEIKRWSLGRTHDHRPVLRLEHPPHDRPWAVPEHPPLRYGAASSKKPYTDTTFTFRNDRDRVFRTIVDALRTAGTPEGESFALVPPGTRADRTRFSHVPLVREV